MKGSDKQVKWAVDIRKKMSDEASQYLGKVEIYDDIIEKILAIDYAEFWIDYRDFTFQAILQSLPTGLRVRGYSFSNLLKADRKSYVLTETWESIVPDNKGGHKEVFSKIW